MSPSIEYLAVALGAGCATVRCGPLAFICVCVACGMCDVPFALHHVSRARSRPGPAPCTGSPQYAPPNPASTPKQRGSDPHSLLLSFDTRAVRVLESLACARGNGYYAHYLPRVRLAGFLVPRGARARRSYSEPGLHWTWSGLAWACLRLSAASPEGRKELGTRCFRSGRAPPVRMAGSDEVRDK